MNDIAFLSIKDGSFTVVDSDLFHELNKHVWARNRGGYIYRYEPGPNSSVLKVVLHRLVNNTPEGKVTDHINGNRNDNRRCNLRTATKSQNAMNWQQSARKRKTSSKYRGVSWHAGSSLWKVAIHLNGKQICLGYFKTQEAAAYAYNDAAVKYFGKFASPNPIPISRQEAMSGEPQCSSRFRGVTYLKKQEGKRGALWRARIMVGEKTYNNHFSTELEAALHYNEMARKYHGADAVLNDVPEVGQMLLLEKP
jgi:HNH endonuclease